MVRLLISLALVLALGRASPPPLESASADDASRPVTLAVLGRTPAGVGPDTGVDLPLAAGVSAFRLEGVRTARDDVVVRGMAVDAARHRATVWFDLPDGEARTVQRLEWSFADGGSHLSPVGAILVVAPPAADDGNGLLVWRRVSRAPQGGVFLAATLVYEGPEPITVEAFAYGPEGAEAPGLLVRRTTAAEAQEAFPGWTASIVAALGDLWRSGRYEPASPRPDLTELPKRLADGSAFRDPATLDMVLHAGDAAWFAVTPAAFAHDVRDAAIFARTSVRVRRGGGTENVWLPGPGVVRHRVP